LTFWRQGWILDPVIFIFYFVSLSLCNKYSDYIMTFISIHSVVIYVVFFGACMRWTRLCPLKPGVTSGFRLPGYVIILLLHSYIFALVCNNTTLSYFENKVSYCNCFRILVPSMCCNVCVTGETLLGKVKNTYSDLNK
jgi:hypothetical protein